MPVPFSALSVKVWLQHTRVSLKTVCNFSLVVRYITKEMANKMGSILSNTDE